ncbi:hypothetical protein ACSSS7_000667 [Eimeria intestinalis]
MVVDCESTRLVRSLYPNVSAFAAGDPPQRGGSRAAFEASSFDRKTVVLPAPYTFSLSRIPTIRVSNTYLETFDFAQRPLHMEAEAEDATQHALYVRDPRDPAALFNSVDVVLQPQSVLNKEYPLEPRKSGSLHQRETCSSGRMSGRPPAPQPPYRIDSPKLEALDAKEALKKGPLRTLKDEQKAFEEPRARKPHRRVQIAGDFAVDRYYSGISPSSGTSCFVASPSMYQRTADQEIAGRRNSSRCVSFVCRAHRGRHVHLLDLPNPRQPSRQRLSSVSSPMTPDGASKGVHKPNSCGAYMMLRRCGCNEAEVAQQSANFAAQPQMTREPRFEESVMKRNHTGHCDALIFPGADRESEKEAYETPQSKARRLGLNLMYYHRNYSDPKLLHSG